VILIAGSLICLVLAPYARPAHLLLMNPYLRGIASLGVIPILITVAPPIRRHLFRRYRRNLNADPELRHEWERYVVPDPSLEAHAFLAKLMTQATRAAVVHGQSGIGKSAFMRYLAQFAAYETKKGSP